MQQLDNETSSEVKQPQYFILAKDIKYTVE